MFRFPLDSTYHGCPQNSRIPERNDLWTESLAVGSQGFVVDIQEQLKARGRKRKITQEEDVFIVCEGLTAYGADFEVEN